MTTTSQAIKAYAEALPEGATLSAKELLHLGERAAVDQALSRLVKRGELLRVRRGLFALPVKTRFGERAPSASTVVESIASTTGERVSISGAAAANILGLSTQNPARQVFWTSGPSRHLKLGAQEVELKHLVFVVEDPADVPNDALIDHGLARTQPMGDIQRPFGKADRLGA